MSGRSVSLPVRVIGRLARETRRGALRQELARLAGASVERGGAWAPGPGLWLAAVVGSAGVRLGLEGAALGALRQLFPELPAAAARSAAADILALDLQNRLLRRFTRSTSRGLEWLAAREVSPADDAWGAITGPAILVSWHIGTTLAIAAGLLRRGTPALVVRHAEDYHAPNGTLDVVVLGSDVERGALALKRAADRLRDGGIVVLALDGAGAGTAPVQCLGRQVRYRRGAFVLARLTGAPLIPVVARWADARRGRFRVEAWPPLEPAARMGESPAILETALAQAAAHQFERLVREQPGLLSVEALLTLAHAPYVDANAALAPEATQSLSRPY